MSESALEPAEGCALAVEEDEYRDYTTFFFAGLTGRTRLGAPIDAAEVDRDGDGRTSFREAHLYALATAHSADLPRATSESYLTDWTPWYLQWDASLDGRSSEYWEIAEQVAERYDWSTSPNALEAQRAALMQAQAHNLAQKTAASERIAASKAELEAALLTRWPELAYPYASSYHALIDADWPDIDRHIRADRRYDGLVEAQDALATFARENLDIRRHLTQVDKIYRLRNLARLETAMRRFGSDQAQREYAELVQCESGTL
jgi:hypothetical protein